MQNTLTLPRPDHRPAIKTLAAQLAQIPRPITVSDIEAYVNSLWCANEDPYLYTTD